TGELPIADQPITLLTVGRMVRQKRFDRFLKIVAQVRNKVRIDVRGLIVGPARGTEDVRTRLEEQATALGLVSGGVEFRGAMSNMAPIYQRSQVCVLTSDHEGTPNVLLEAMASGLPVVATRVGGVPEIVRHQETGFVLDPGDIDGFVAALAQLATDSRLRMEMGRRARRYVETHHSLQRLPGRLSELYELALAR